MNVTELARKLNTSPGELRALLPKLGFSIGRRAIKVDKRMVSKIEKAFGEYKRKQRLAKKVEQQKRLSEKTDEDTADKPKKKLELPSVITVRDLATEMNMPVPKLMQELMRNGILASINERIDFDTASIIVEDLGFEAVNAEGGSEDDEENKGVDRLAEIAESETDETLEARPPVIVVMGHVDHGKTKLLDAVRKTDVVATESGGITQHIGAYQVTRNERSLTFIDTPGHEAFTVMRSRGAKVADIAILVVAADDGVQPQTKEAANIIKSAQLPFIVALNKIDRPEANIDKVKSELSELGFIPEDWGGKTVMVPISAKEGQGIEDLLDTLVLVADMEASRIRSNPNRKAIGTVIESHVDKTTGPVATVLVQSGTLSLGDDLGVNNELYGRVRAMKDWNGEDTKSASPSMPVKILGWKAAPAVGDIMEVPLNAKALNKVRTDRSRGSEEVAAIKQVKKDEAESDTGTTLNLIIRADVLGSLEAILGMLDTIKHDEVSVKVVSKGLGNITETDIATAEASKAIVIGFNTKPTASAAELSRDKEVEVREYSIIYKLFEAVLEDLEKLLPSETVITEVGKFEVLANFKKMDNGWIIGGKVAGGKLVPKALLRLSREGEYIGEGSIENLRLGKAEIKDAKMGQEIGLQYKGKVKPEAGDILEAYTQERKSRALYIEGVSKR